ncbi:EndoU nuclease [Nitrosomonas cryotolerans]|uniref:EndoU nuclease n=1 Tax=Nitrosomonas cryotolerans ATCC 49181 TaxID=1131553 RepID=A0A1N6ICJ6_9PROT|nr:EndoU nuclease [Nitrosomonas cryotolerans]SIO29709.1 EndoU nuclease [Nitrosomonas cryotolerans ATCC 49181]
MYTISVKRITPLVLLVLFLLPLTVQAEINCSTLPRWVTLHNGLQINQQHIFCGEWRKDRPKGFHSRPNGLNPSTIAYFTIQDSPNAAGVYTGRWSYQHRLNKNKFSSMFPDHCSIEQVLNSISYASAYSSPHCPSGSPDWLTCGQNKPPITEENSIQFCSINNQSFTIAFARLKDGRINTAFPIYD